MVAGPEISRLIGEFTSVDGTIQEKKQKHHEENLATQKKFHSRVNRLQCILEEMGSPFEEESQDLYSIDNKDVVESEAAHEILKMAEMGGEQYRAFLSKMRDSSGFYEPIKKNKCRLFKPKPKTEAAKSKLMNLKDDCNLFSRLFIAAQSRQCDLQEFFQHENQVCPASLSRDGMLYLGVKSQLMSILEADVEKPTTVPVVDSLVIDGASLVNSREPGSSKTFDEYASDVIVLHIQSLAQTHSRIDFVFDVYYEDSLKAETRRKRGQGSRRKVAGNTKPPKSWNTFLRYDENKTELFCFLADKISSMDTDKIIFVTKEKDVVCNKAVDTEFLAPCSQEEADTRMFLHAKHQAVGGSKSISIVSSDTDVVVIAVSVFEDLNLDKLYGSLLGKVKICDGYQFIQFLDLSALSRTPYLSFIHAFTGCDTVSAFVGKGKLTAWQAWKVFENVTETFCKLSKPCDTLTEDDIDIIEEFVVIMYDRSSESRKVNETRFDLFARKQRSFGSIPPTKVALVEHIKRSVLQAGHTWGQSLSRTQILPSPSRWG